MDEKKESNVCEMKNKNYHQNYHGEIPSGES